jgi:hypothetical protein
VHALVEGIFIRAKGRKPQGRHEAVIDQAIRIIETTPGFEAYGRTAKGLQKYVWTYGEPIFLWDGEAWAFDPHYAPWLVLTDKLLDEVDPVLVASNIVHETHHTYQPPLFKGRWRGEQGAYQAQSDFLRAVGIAGDSRQIANNYVGSSRDFITDLRDAFKEYRVQNAAISTPN